MLRRDPTPVIAAIAEPPLRRHRRPPPARADGGGNLGSAATTRPPRCCRSARRADRGRTRGTRSRRSPHTPGRVHERTGVAVPRGVAVDSTRRPAAPRHRAPASGRTPRAGALLRRTPPPESRRRTYSRHRARAAPPRSRPVHRHRQPDPPARRHAAERWTATRPWTLSTGVRITRPSIATPNVIPGPGGSRNQPAIIPSGSTRHDIPRCVLPHPRLLARLVLREPRSQGMTEPTRRHPHRQLAQLCLVLHGRHPGQRTDLAVGQPTGRERLTNHVQVPHTPADPEPLAGCADLHVERAPATQCAQVGAPSPVHSPDSSSATTRSTSRCWALAQPAPTSITCARSDDPATCSPACTATTAMTTPRSTGRTSRPHVFGSGRPSQQA